jgi:hypothetical protein
VFWGGGALRLRWLWFTRTDPGKPWVAMPVTNDAETLVFFRASITTTVGNGASTFFWIDHWLNGQSIGELAPELLAVVLQRRRKKRTVCSTLIGNAWLSDIVDPLTLPVII